MANIVGTPSDDILNGTSSDDTIDGAGGNDVLDGLDGNDSLIGSSGNDTLYGGDGDDTLTGGAGDDWHYGGAGTDTVEFSGAYSDFGSSQSWGADGTFLLYGFNSAAEGVDFLNTDVERLQFSDRQISLLNGTSGNDTLNGTDGIDWIHGQAGDDLLVGGAGDDRLDGESGHDTLLGGDGNDALTGWDGDDVFIGGAGDDAMYGGAGSDTAQFDGAYKDYTISALYVGKDGFFSGYQLSSAEGIDYVDYDVEYLQFRGRSIALSAGTSGNDTLNGTSSSDITQGLEGDDLLFGGRKDDALYGGAGNDIIDGGAHSDSLTGGAGTDVLVGGSGNDVLAGNEGADTLIGGSGRDTFVFDSPLSAANVDLVQDFQLHLDAFLLSAGIFQVLAGQTVLSASQFYSAPGASSATAPGQVVIYDPDTGNLLYDADGPGGAAAIQWAIVGTAAHPDLSAEAFPIG